MARHQERVAQWEAATAHDEEQLHQRRAALEVQTLIPALLQSALVQLAGVGTI